MPELPELPKVPDSLAGLRASVAAHAAAVDASKRAGAQLQAERTQAPAPTTEQPQ